MEAASLRAPHPLPTPAPAAHEWDWVYDDPDLAPFRGRASTKGRAETPLTAFT